MGGQRGAGFATLLKHLGGMNKLSVTGNIVLYFTNTHCEQESM